MNAAVAVDRVRQQSAEALATFISAEIDRARVLASMANPTEPEEGQVKSLRYAIVALEVVDKYLGKLELEPSQRNAMTAEVKRLSFEIDCLESASTYLCWEYRHLPCTMEVPMAMGRPKATLVLD